jgi:hypothetical protein
MRLNWLKILKYMKYALWLLLAVALFWSFKILIDQEQWLGISALSTFLLAFAAFFTIQEANKREKSRRRENLLNEIIEWAKEIREISSTSVDPSKADLDSPLEQIPTQRDFRYWYRKYQELNDNSVYIEEVAAKVFGDKLLSIVRDVSGELNNIIELLANCLTKKAKENSEKVEKRKEAIDRYAEKLMKEATKLKTQGLR